MTDKLGTDAVKTYFASDTVVQHYEQATGAIGLWASEEELFTRYFKKDDRILEAGTGTGRIAIGLYELGYRHILGFDLSKQMVARARKIAQILEYSIAFRQTDATQLKLDEDLFDGAIFGFNGLMQIPGRENRRRAMAEIHRVVRPGGIFIFTTHDRDLQRWKKFWRQQKDVWNAGLQDPSLHEFGDRYDETDLGKLFLHVPSTTEIREDLKATGWKCDLDMLRSDVANESPRVRDFSDECRFWIARKE